MGVYLHCRYCGKINCACSLYYPGVDIYSSCDICGKIKCSCGGEQELCEEHRPSRGRSKGFWDRGKVDEQKSFQ